MLFTPRCSGCHRAGVVLCNECWSALHPASPFAVPAALDSCRALLDYCDTARSVLGSVKFRKRTALVGWLGSAIAELAHTDVDSVTWAPTTLDRRRQRGYDQAELIALVVGRHVGLPVRSLLRRVAGPAQTGLSRNMRLKSAMFVPRRDCPPRVLLIDDVLTTGATLGAAARCLRAAGADEIHGLVVAHRP